MRKPESTFNCLDSSDGFPMIGSLLKESRFEQGSIDMLMDGGIIKAAMSKRGFKHRRAEDQFSIRGEYGRNLQFVYSREYSAKAGLVVDLAYFSADVVAEKLVIGFYRENPKIENGVYINTSCSIPLRKFNAVEIDCALDKLITPVKDTLK